MQPPDLGYYTVDDRVGPGCTRLNPEAWRDRWQERAMSRRRDVGAPTWGKGGVPVMDMTVGGDTYEGLASLDTRPLQQVPTEQGAFNIPYGEDPSVGYMPSVAALTMLPYADQRRSGISDRYYK